MKALDSLAFSACLGIFNVCHARGVRFMLRVPESCRVTGATPAMHQDTSQAEAQVPQDGAVWCGGRVFGSKVTSLSGGHPKACELTL